MPSFDPESPVWITGVGLATPMGHDLATLEANLLAGRSGVTAVTRFPASDYLCRVAAQVGDVPPPPSFSPADFDALTRLERIAARPVEMALRDSGWWGRHRAARVGLVLGVGAEWMETWEEDEIAGGDRIEHPERDVETAVQKIGRLFGLSGPCLTLSAACASTNFALEIARRWLRAGLVDVCLAGGAESAVTPIGLATFGNLRALTRRNDDPAGASRPFDKGRDGFVLGEGGVVFVMERADDAARRSAPAYAEVAGCGSSSDAHHQVIPSPDPTHAAAAIRLALADAGLNPEDVDHVNAHATSTPVGDACEAAVLKLVFGADSKVPVTSTKSMTGHLLTAAGAIEAVACFAAMKHGAIPPTINLEERDVDLNIIANEAREADVRVAVSNSFGFGGSNTCLVLRAV
ncbi:MAG TPA: beta-ketoacyl-[acyl-carrier-protein] synthase family protein [Isosphaeraceae bacterium]